jgi:beta-glucosidase
MRYLFFLAVSILVIISCAKRNEIQDSSFSRIYPCNDKDIEEKINSLLKSMTLQEKAAQMLNIGLPAVLTGKYWDKRESVHFDSARFHKFIVEYGVGSIHNTPRYPATKEEWYYIVKTIQDSATQRTSHGIPVLYGIDNIHGANYVLYSNLLPHQIALAATWNREITRKSAELTSYQSRAASLPWNFNPNADLAPNPLWGRIAECFGEDPYLISEMTAAYIKGSQGKGLQDSMATAVCVKHFVGYGAGINGKDRANAIIPENYLWQYYLPSFKRAVNEAAMGIMISSNSVNGIPCHINRHYITDILKGELGFRGVVISDFSDIEFLVTAHQAVDNKKEATKLAINAGLDMIMNPYDADVVDYIVELVKSGDIEMSRIDDAVRRILRLKFYLNLFNKPYNNPKGFTHFSDSSNIEFNYQAAAEAITLLKNNNNILPISKNSKILVTGYAANSANILNGAWSRSFLGRETTYNDSTKLTIYQALASELGSKNVRYVQGTNYTREINISEAVKEAKNCDLIIACVGEIPASEKPSDINELELPEAQQELVRQLYKTGKPIILVLVEGRPRIIREIEPLAKGIVMAYLPGEEGGRAITDILLGKINPSGKLPYTYPLYCGNLLPYWHKKTDVRDTTWAYDGFYRQYDFGFGLSYTTWEYSNLTLNADSLSGNDTLKIEILLKNTGNRSGKEITQVYVRDLFSIIVPDMKKLVRFTKSEILPNEEIKVIFKLVKDDLSSLGVNNMPVLETGEFEVLVGGDPNNCLTAKFHYKN